MNQKIFAVIIATAIPFALIIFLYKSTKTNIDVVFSRKYSSTILVQNSTVQIDLTDASRIQKFNDTYYIYDIGENQIVKLSAQGKPLNLYPSQCNKEKFGLVLGYSIDTSQLLVIDPRKRHYVNINTKTCFLQNDTLFALERGVPINDSSILCVVLDTITNDVNFKLRNVYQKNDVIIPSSFKKYGDGGFGNDGLFSNSTNKKKYCYLLYHIGMFYTIDLTSNSVEAHNTVDKYSTPPEVVRSGSRFTLSRKTVTVNRISANNTKYLFVVSNVKTREDKKANIKSDIIDIYNLETGQYLNSIQIDGTEKNHIIDLYAEENSLSLLTHSKIIVYAIKKNQ